jgi:hypothetical protein
MAVQHLFNSSGEWIAFRKGKFVFATDGTWIGWLPWDESEVVDTSGSYIGHIYGGNRLYRRTSNPYRGYPGYPGYPGYAGYKRLPRGLTDVDLENG